MVLARRQQFLRCVHVVTLAPAARQRGRARSCISKEVQHIDLTLRARDRLAEPVPVCSDIGNTQDDDGVVITFISMALVKWGRII